MISKICRNCQSGFEISDQDLKFYEKISSVINGQKFLIPPPTFCPDCRQQRRLSWRNERKLYHGKCDLCGKEMISIYSSDKPFKVYCQNCYWSDKWDPIEFSKEIDFNESFLNQFSQLLKDVPRLAIINRNSVNSDYTNICEDNKNCYLLVESSTNEDCLYGYWLQKSKDCTDCSYCNECELCYECDNCQNCYNLKFSKNCQNCFDSFFLKNCNGCKNCCGSVNLNQAEYCFFNKKLSKDEYFIKLNEFFNDSYVQLHNFNKYYREHKLRFPNKYSEISFSENCTGDYITHSKNCINCFSASEAWDCKYSYNIWRNSKDNMDVDTSGMNSELNYECINTAINSTRNIGCIRCWGVNNSFYCNECDYS